MTIKVAAVSLNQTPLDWYTNKQNIQHAINQVRKDNIDLLVFPELVTTGYGCEDGFFTEELSQESLYLINTLSIPSDMYIVIGTPLEINNRLYNAAAILCGNEIIGFVLKQNLAINGIHYENRWFNPWEAGKVVQVKVGNKTVPAGDIVIDANGVRLGFEICEDAWVASRPGRTLFDRGVDVIINPSASHFAIGKYQTREQFVKEGSRSFGAAYIYSNLNGCESGRAIFDGGNLIASNGEIIARGERFHYKDVSVTYANIDVKENRIAQMNNSQQSDIESINTNVVFHDVPLESEKNKYLNTSKINESEQRFSPAFSWTHTPYLEHEEASRAVSLGLFHWLMKTNTNGFVLSLSGGADSGLVASHVYYMVKYIIEARTFVTGRENQNTMNDFFKKFVKAESYEAYFNQEPEAMSEYDFVKEIVGNILTCVYQGSENSGDVTLNAAREVSNFVGAKFHNWIISDLVTSYTDLVNSTSEYDMTWENDDIALQNIQARVRAPGVWMIANRDNKLLLTTGNLSEAAVGYMTMDGDTAGVLAPISGISKTRILDMLVWMEKEGSLITTKEKLEALSFINNQRPTAELRPDEQADEDDLMPFYIMDYIRKQAFMMRKSPRRIYEGLKQEYPDGNVEEYANYIRKFYTLFSRNQWKRDRAAPSFHIEMDSLDPKTYSRYPLLNGGWKKELASLDHL